MTTCNKLFSISNRLVNRLFAFQNISLNQFSPFLQNERYYSTSPAIVQEKFTKLSGDLIKPASPPPKDKYTKKITPQATNYDADPTSVLSRLKELDYQVRKWGRLDSEKLNDILKDCKEKFGSVEASMLIRCVGSFLVIETPEERQDMCNKVWKIIEDNCTDINIQVYNSLLMTKLENHHLFSPADVLNDLENVKKITPSKITYQLLLAGFCEQGDIVGAGKITEHMKTSNYPLNHFVLHYLIRGHVKKGDLTGANDIISSMSTHGLAVTQETYRMYLLTLAEEGKMDVFDQVLSQARKANVEINTRAIYDIALASALSKEAAQTSQVLNLLNYVPETNPLYHDAMNTALQLTALGRHEAAVKVLQIAMPEGMQVDRNVPMGTRLLRAHISKFRSAETLLNINNQLIACGLSNVPDTVLVHWAAMFGNVEYGLEIIKEVKKQKGEVTTKHYWPLLKASMNKNDLEEIYKVVREMSVNCTNARDPILGTLSRLVVPKLILLGQTLENIIEKFKEFEMNPMVVERIQSSALIMNGDLKMAAQLIKNSLGFSPMLLKFNIPDGFYKEKSLENLIKLMRVLRRQMNTKQKELSSDVLLGLLDHADANAALAQQLIAAWSEHKFTVTPESIAPIEQLLAKLEVSEEVLGQASLLAREIPTFGKSEFSSKLSIEELEEKLKETPASTAIKKFLLIKYCTEGIVDKALAIKQDLDKNCIIYSPQLLRQLGYMEARFRQNKMASMQYLDLLCRQYPEMLRYVNLLFEICTIQLLEGNHQDAINLLTLHVEKMKPQLESDGFSDGYIFNAKCMQLLTASTGVNPHTGEVVLVGNSGQVVCDPQKTYDLVEVLYNGFVKKGSYSLLDFAVQVFLKHCDLDGLLVCYERCVLRYKVAPRYVDVLEKLVQNDAKAKLNKVVELTQKVFDESEVQLALFFVYVKCNKLSEASKIMQIPGLKFDFQKMGDHCSRLVKYNKEKELLSVVEMTKGLPINMEAIFHLFRYYAKIKNTEKIESTFKLFAENNIKPTKGMQRLICSVYTSLNLEEPFYFPEKSLNMETIDQTNTNALSKKTSFKSRQKNTQQSNLAEQKRETKIDELSAENEEIEDKGPRKNEKLTSMDEVAKIVESITNLESNGKKTEAANLVFSTGKHFINLRDYKAFRMFVFNISEKENLMLISALRSLKLPTRYLTRFFNKRLFLTYIANKRGAEIVSFLESNGDQLDLFVSQEVLQQLQDNDDASFLKMEKLITELGDTPSNFPLVHLYNYYDESQKDKSLELIQANPLLNKRIQIRQSRLKNPANSNKSDEEKLD